MNPFHRIRAQFCAGAALVASTLPWQPLPCKSHKAFVFKKLFIRKLVVSPLCWWKVGTGPRHQEDTRLEQSAVSIPPTDGEIFGVREGRGRVEINGERIGREEDLGAELYPG